MDKPLRLPALFTLVGVSNYQGAVLRCVEGQPVEVTHEADNPYDPNACVVRSTDGHTLGYLPRALAPRLLAAGSARFSAMVSELRPGETWGLAVQVIGPAGSAAEKPAVPAPVAAEVLAARDGVDGLVGAGACDGVSPTVFAKSGRELGLFVRHDGTKVVVRKPSGLEAAFPDELVRIGGPV